MLARFLSRLAYSWLHLPPYYMASRLRELSGTAQLQQLLLMLHYRELAARGGPLPPTEDMEFSVYSQSGEDGILWYIFSLIGTTNKTVVEIGAGDGIENNSANLLVHHGWKGFLFDASAERLKTARQFYGAIPQTRLWPPAISCAWIHAGNVNDVLRQAGVEGEVDLFSLDIDGIDYWVWEALSVIDPRVVVVEFNNLWEADAAVSVPNDPMFKAEYNSPQGADYSGASLGAFMKLAARKGYRLAACQRYGYNAFFVRDPVGRELLPAIDPGSCLTHPFAQHARTVRYPRIKDKAWVRV